MKGFFTIFLRIILVLSFVAVIAFVTVVVVSNINVAYDSYAYITTSQANAPYEHFAINVDKYVRVFDSPSTSASLIRDEKALFLTNTVDSVNLAINHFADYLSVEGNLSKKEQTALNRAYKAYKEAFDNTIDVYNGYISLMTEILGQDGLDHVWEVYERNKFSGKEETLVNSYYQAYVKGSEFFRILLDNVRSHTLSSGLTFGEIVLCLRVYYADKALADIFVNGGDMSTSNAVKEYGKVISFDSITDDDMLVNSTVTTFVNDANSMDVYRLVNDYLPYLDTLSSNDRQKAMRAVAFVQDNILV